MHALSYACFAHLASHIFGYPNIHEWQLLQVHIHTIFNMQSQNDDW